MRRTWARSRRGEPFDKLPSTGFLRRASFDKLRSYAQRTQDIRLAICRQFKRVLPRHAHPWPAMSERSESNGAEGSRTLDLCIANAALSQLSYRPDLASAIWGMRADAGKLSILEVVGPTVYRTNMGRIGRSLRRRGGNRCAFVVADDAKAAARGRCSLHRGGWCLASSSNSGRSSSKKSYTSLNWR